METKMEKEYMKGGAFLIEEQAHSEIFTPEDFTEEHRMIGDTTREFVDNEVTPQIEAMEQHAWEVARQLVAQAGELGLLGATIPEEYGGLGLDQTTGVVIAEYIGRGGGFGTTFGAQTSIGLLPILYFGSEELRQKWIPKIVSGEVVTAYCLSEAGSGSDALGAKCTAKLTEDGEMDIFRPGVSHILARDPVPVVPLALRGLWGSFFSRAHGKAMTRPFVRGLFSRIELVAGDAIDSAAATPERLQAAVLSLRGDRR